MATKTTVRKCGSSCGVILGKDVLEQLGVGPGDALFIVSTDDGVRLSSFDPEVTEAIEAGRDYMNRHHDALAPPCKRNCSWRSSWSGTAPGWTPTGSTRSRSFLALAGGTMDEPAFAAWVAAACS